MIRIRKSFVGLSLPILLAAIPLVSCLNEAATSPGRTVSLENQPTSTATNPRLDFLVKILGILQSNITLYVDPVTGDSSYVVSPKLSDLLTRLKKLRKYELHQGSYALKLATIDTLMERYEKTRLSEGIDISSQNPVAGAAGGGLAKTSHTRWKHWTSLLDVKAMYEVRQIKVFIKQTGSDALGPNWRTGLRNAMANWTAQAKGTAISFVEVSDINTADVVLRGAYGLGSDGLMSYVVWLNPGPYIERIPSYGGPGNGMSVDLVFNIGYENPSMPISEKTKIGMVALANITNIGWIDTENWYWNFGDFVYIPGTLHTDGDPYTPGSSIMLQYSTQVSTPAMTAGDVQLFQALYPAHGITAKLNYNSYALTVVGQNGYSVVYFNVNSFATEGDTLIFSTLDGKLFRRVGLNGSNVQVWPASGSSGNVVSFTHSRGYLAVYTGSRIYSRTPTSGSWVKQQGDAVASSQIYRLDGEKLYVTTIEANGQQALRLRYLTSDPGSWYLDWMSEGAGTVTDYQARNGMLVVADNGNLWAKKDGAFGWNAVHWNYSGNGLAKRVMVSNDLITFYREFPGDPNGYAAVLVGGVIGGGIHYIPDPMFNSADMDVCGDKFAYIQQGAYLRVIDYATWVVHEHFNIPGHYDNTTKVRLGGSTCEFVTIMDNANRVWAKYGVSLETDYFPYQPNVAALAQRP